MAQDLTDTVRDALGNVMRDAFKNIGGVAPTKSKSGPLSGGKGIAAGMGLAAAAPLAKKGFDAIRADGLSSAKPGKLAGGAAAKAGERVSTMVKGAVSSTVEEAGGAGGLVKEAASGLLPGTGDAGGGGGKGGVPGVGKGRRMPVQQSVDVAVPIETAYNQFTQFEDWPQFMHRVTRVTQEDECTVSFATKIWAKTKEFEAKIETQRPDERIKWRVSQGITHTGVVTFHELAPRLTRIELNMDVDPGSLIEKAARGMRHVKRAARADLHRYKAFIEMQELETGAWRGVIEEGEVVEQHDDSYDEERDYADVKGLLPDKAKRSEDEEKGEGNGSGRERTQRFKRQAERSRGGAKATASSGSSSRSASSGRSGGSSGRSGGSSGQSSGSSGRSSGSSSKSGGSSSRSGGRSSGSSSSSSRSRGGSSGGKTGSSATPRRKANGGS
jgi:uncharacterized membrane protein